MSPARPNNVEEFISLAVKSGLRADAELQEVLKSFREGLPTPFENLDAELRGFCDFLVSSGSVTRWQCDMLLNGKHRGFFIDISFRLLYPVPRDDSYLRFVAEEIQTTRRVVVRVTPAFARSREDSQPKFEIDEMHAPEP